MTSATTGRLDLTVMVAFHDAFRRDLAHLARVASRRHAHLDDPARRTAVLAGWELFRTYLHIHHSAEDTDLWPRMRTHLADRPDDLALLQAMEDEHARLDPLVAAVDRAFTDRDGGHQHLADTVDALASELHGHLRHEERDALPLLDRSLTPAEWQAFSHDQRRRLGFGGAAQLFPWLLQEASPNRPRPSWRASRRRCEKKSSGAIRRTTHELSVRLEEHPAVVSVTATGVQVNDLKVSDELWDRIRPLLPVVQRRRRWPGASQWTTGRA